MIKVVNILETAQKKELRALVEEIKEILEKDFLKKLSNFGIQQNSNILIPLDDLNNFEFIETEDEKEKFESLRNLIWDSINQESDNLESWEEAYHWFLDKLIYSFFNRIFAIKILEELELLNESTLISHSELGKRSARMAKIQENFPENPEDWYIFLLKDAFGEISKEVKIIFDELDPVLNVWPDGDEIDLIINKLNQLNSEIYKAEDCIGWFYHYYVLKFRKGHKTMSAHGKKSPKNPYYLSILNTVYTPRWMIQVLVDNSLGHWWQFKHPDSEIFLNTPFFIQKIPSEIDNVDKELRNIKILDPACGSGNFLVYSFNKLVQMYLEEYPELDLLKIIKNILSRNLYGIDINRRPAQLSALALYIMAKRIIKEKSPELLNSFQMPAVNIICCDIRAPPSNNKVILLQKIKNNDIRKIIKDLIDQFDKADELGSLIEIRHLQEELNKLKRQGLDKFFKKNERNNFNLTELIDERIFNGTEQNIGLQLFGLQTKNALTLAQTLMKKFDIIITNPPFGLMIDSTKEKLKSFYPNSYNDLVSAFIEKSLRMLNKNGYVGMVTDFSFMHLPKFKKFREEVLLKNYYIQYMILVGENALPDAANSPNLFIIRNANLKERAFGFYRNINVRFFKDAPNPIDSIKSLNEWDERKKFPPGWNKINQLKFLDLPRSVIDLNIAKKYDYLIDFFTKYPRLDISQHNKNEKERLSDLQIARAYQGIATGNNDLFVRYWFEVNPNQIRKVELIDDITDVPVSRDNRFVPFSKGGGNIRYYLNNGYILWWNKDSINEMKNQNCRLQNLSLIGKSDIHWSLSSATPRGRFNISQNGLITDVASMGIHLKFKKLDKFSLLAYLNSKFGFFFGRLQTKDRKWQAGNIARFPVPLDFLIDRTEGLSTLTRESYELRREWDTGYPMSPIFSESIIDKIITSSLNNSLVLPNTGHPFCEEYSRCNSDTAKKINNSKVNLENLTFKEILDNAEERFILLTQRLDQIDNEINEFLYNLIEKNTAESLDDFYNKSISEQKYNPEKEIWLKDFLMANLIELVKNKKSGIISLRTYKEHDRGLYESFINYLSEKFKKDFNEIQPFLRELEELLEKDLKTWISDDFFFYHCQRFGGRPIIWHFTSRSNLKLESALDIFIDYHKINENTLPMVRIDYIQLIQKIFKQRKDTGILSQDEAYKLDEINEFLNTIIALENGYEVIPNPNALTSNNAPNGKGNDKTYNWLFKEVKKIIKGGYKPNLEKGILINLIPLCLKVPESKSKEFSINFKYLCPSGTINNILKKIDALDQLKNK